MIGAGSSFQVLEAFIELCRMCGAVALVFKGRKD